MTAARKNTHIPTCICTKEFEIKFCISCKKRNFLRYLLMFRLLKAERFLNLLYMKWFIKAWNQSFDFKGRARRTEFWMFTLFCFIFALCAMLIDYVLGTGIFSILWRFAIIIPTLAVSVRRLHDVGKSGWMYLIGLIPVIGTIWLLVLFCTDSQAEQNKWGMCPK